MLQRGGVNYIDVDLAYDNGATLDVVAEFLKTVKREDFFINVFITHGCESISDMEKQIKTYMDRLQVDWVDCVTLHSPVAIKFDFSDYIKEIKRLQKKYKFPYIGYSNISPEMFEQVKDHISYFEGLYNLENKINEDTGIIEACQKNNTAFYAFQPLRRNRTAKQNYPELVRLAKEYGKTQNQILINWMVKHKNIGVLIKSSSKEYIKENIEALNFDMSGNDYKTLDKFRNAEFDKLKVSYYGEEGTVRIESVPNQPIGIL